jgi:hypothetical protein
MCFGADILGLNSGAKRQASALERQAQQERLVAQGVQQQTQATLAQTKAASAAQELLSTPAETTSVALGSAPADTVDATTGRRKAVRQSFRMTADAGSGITL